MTIDDDGIEINENNQKERLLVNMLVSITSWLIYMLIYIDRK